MHVRAMAKLFQRTDTDRMTEATKQPASQVRTEPIRMKWSEKNRTVLIEGKGEDRFPMKVREVIQACNIRQRANDYEAQFATLNHILGQWLYLHKEQIYKAFITVRDGHLLFLTVTNVVKCDADFEDALTDLDLAITQTPFLSDIFLSVQSLPYCDNDAYGAFLSPPTIIEYAHP